MKTTENRKSNGGKTTQMKTNRTRTEMKEYKLTVVTPHTTHDKISLRLVLKRIQD